MAPRRWDRLVPLAGLVVALSGATPAWAELKVGISGYIKLDIQYGDKNTGEFPSPSPNDVPLKPDAVRAPDTFNADREKDHGQTLLDARQSRLRATFSDEVGGVKISGRLETDFFTRDADDAPGLAVSNSARLRLRHAFVRGEHPSGFFLLAGQTWSLVFNEIAQPDLVDFNGPAGQVFARQPQLRVGYRMPVGGGELVLEADIEKHFTTDLGSANVNEGRGEGQDVPLFSGKVSWLGKALKIEAGGAVADSQVTFSGGRTASETAWLAQVSGEVNLEPLVGLPVTLFGHYHHNDGLGRLLGGDFGNAVLVSTTTAGTPPVIVSGQIQNIETDGLYGGITYRLTKRTSFNAVYGYHKADEIPAGGFTGNRLEKHQSYHVNVIHKFWDRWQAGLEYRRFEVNAFNGRDGDVNLIHAAIWYFF
jgi:hypothetical protein